MLTMRDRKVIRDLASDVAEIAALPVQEEKRVLWRKLNGLQPERPMVMIDQVCWHEMDVDGDLTLRCSDPECRMYEDQLRRTLFQWKHFRVDMVVEPYVSVPMAVRGTGFGITAVEEVAVNDPRNPVVGHKFENQFQKEDDLEKIRTPHVFHDTRETCRRLNVAHELFDGLLEVVPGGVDPYLSLWDPVASWMGVENALYALVDRPDFMHRFLTRMTDGYLAMLDQLEAQGLLCGPQPRIHCTGGYSDELPAPDYNPLKPRTKDLWMFGLAQMLATVSPTMFETFEVDYMRRICRRFGLVYYGCCDPLDGKMKEVRRLPGVRKISMSPWADQERGAAEIRGDYVFSRKPSPALLATNRFDLTQVEHDLRNTRTLCEAYGCPLEFILKDLSTVRYEPERLFAWARVAMEIADGNS